MHAPQLIVRIPAAAIRAAQLPPRPSERRSTESVSPQNSIVTNSIATNSSSGVDNVSVGDEASKANSKCSMASTADEQPGRKRREKPKRWYEVQKDKKLALKDEIARLETQRAAIRCAWSRPHHTETLQRQQQMTAALRRAIWERHLAFARAQSALSSNSFARVPFRVQIRLGADSTERAALLAQLKPSVLRDAEQFLVARVQELDLTCEHSERAQFTLPNGDRCFSGVDVLPLARCCTSVAQVLSAMRAFLCNVEITWTETSSELMVREGDFEIDSDSDVATQRHVRVTASGAQIESNSVMFTKLTRASQGESESGDQSVESSGDSAVVAVHYVDADELFPYRPNERLRKDIAAVLMLTTHDCDTSDGATTPTIVLTRAYFGRLHPSARVAQLTSDADEFYFASTFWLQTMLQSVRDNVALSEQAQCYSDCTSVSASVSASV